MKSCMNHPMFQVSALKERYFSRWRMAIFPWSSQSKSCSRRKPKRIGLRHVFHEFPQCIVCAGLKESSMMKVRRGNLTSQEPCQASSTNPTTSRAQTCKWWCVASDIQPKSGSQSHKREATNTDLPQRIGFQLADDCFYRTKLPSIYEGKSGAKTGWLMFKVVESGNSDKQQTFFFVISTSR